MGQVRWSIPLGKDRLGFPQGGGSPRGLEEELWQALRSLGVQEAAKVLRSQEPLWQQVGRYRAGCMRRARFPSSPLPSRAVLQQMAAQISTCEVWDSNHCHWAIGPDAHLCMLVPFFPSKPSICTQPLHQGMFGLYVLLLDVRNFSPRAPFAAVCWEGGACCSASSSARCELIPASGAG